ncbi:MAG: alpha/beta fold hydrolase [Actinobacteria bacterium]|nr:alpha/beta fold hydrolase [Actinomycetota bacterium]
MTKVAGARAQYLGGTPGDRSFALLHEPDAAAPARDVAVLLCSPFGNDDLCTYRVRREWAQQLAAAGFATLRVDLPGCGDGEGGPRDPGRAAAWTQALDGAARWLRAQTGCARVAALGIGLGGLLACEAASAGAPIDDLVLWAVPARGRTFVRELRALARLEAANDTAAAAQSDDGALASAGYVLSAETLAALEALDLAQRTLPDGTARRALLLERDGLAPDPRLRTMLDEAGVAVTVAPGPGYGTMVAEPHRALAPREVFETVAAWLAEPAPASAPHTDADAAAPPPAEEALELVVDGTPVRETPFAIARPSGELFALLSEPAEGERAPLTLLLLNAGAQRHIGPNRMWVEIARRWAARGVPVVRVDLPGIGDAQGEDDAWGDDEGFYVERFTDDTLAVLDALQARGLPPRFVLGGLCSGAYWSFHAALRDERVASALMLNSRALFWDHGLDARREARNVSKVVNPVTWLKLLRGRITRERARLVLRSALDALLGLPARLAAHRRRRVAGDELAHALDVLEARATALVAVFTASEPLLDELERSGKLARMRERTHVWVEAIPGPLSSHTLEPLPLQGAVHGIVDDALERELARAGGPADARAQEALR